MSAWTCRSFDGKAAVKIVPPRPRIPWWKGLGADSEEKREPVSDIDTAAADSLKVLDPKRPIREADIALGPRHVRFTPESGHSSARFPRPLCEARSLTEPVANLFNKDNPVDTWSIGVVLEEADIVCSVGSPLIRSESLKPGFVVCMSVA